MKNITWKLTNNSLIVEKNTDHGLLLLMEVIVMCSTKGLEIIVSDYDKCSNDSFLVTFPNKDFDIDYAVKYIQGNS